jgi:hypothetical protein
MSENELPPAPSAAVTAVVQAASEKDVEKVSAQLLDEKFNEQFQTKSKKLQRMKFRNEQDIIDRFPYPDELTAEDGVYEWQAPGHTSYVVISQDLVPAILDAEWANVPNSTGRTKFASRLKSLYVGGPSQPQITEFLYANDEHQLFRHRKRSQLTSTSVAQAPFKVLACDLSDVERRGSIRYLLVCVDLFSKFAWVTPLTTKSAAVVAREIDKILASLPPGARVGSLRTDVSIHITQSAVALQLTYSHNFICVLPTYRMVQSSKMSSSGLCLTSLALSKSFHCQDRQCPMGQ